MSDAPVYDIDVESFWQDPYPVFADMRANAPICFVPQLGATLINRHADVSANEKNTKVFSSWQPEGLMTVLMGENLMRKDGKAHMDERRAIYPSMSPQTVKNVWHRQFDAITRGIIDGLANDQESDLFWSFAMPVSGECLRAIIGLPNMAVDELNRVSQGMIDGCANYTGDPDVEANCHNCTASIDTHIDQALKLPLADDDASLLATQLRAGMTEEQIRANIKLSISGGQNEPRDAIAGAIWALLTHPDQLELIRSGEASWLNAFEEYARWISPIGMSPRRIAKAFTYEGVTFEPEDRVFFMFSSANRDDDVFDNPDVFDVTRDIGKSLSFGAGPHYCAGAWASRTMIADIALPQFFERFQNPQITDEVKFGGWAFRGPLNLPCRWDAIK